MSMLEDRLREALVGSAGRVHESPDLFARIVLSIEDDRRRRRQRRHAAGIVAAVLIALGGFLVAVMDVREGDLVMDWWILELLTTGVLTGVALWLGPFIKRFGRSYAADVFRANPGTGKSFIVLTDFAYYLIFLSFILFTTTFELPSNWDNIVNGAQIKSEVARVAGVLLIIGLLHGLNLIVLPVIGRLLTLNRHLDEQMGHGPTPPDAPDQR